MQWRCYRKWLFLELQLRIRGFLWDWRVGQQFLFSACQQKRFCEARHETKILHLGLSRVASPVIAVKLTLWFFFFCLVVDRFCAADTRTLGGNGNWRDELLTNCVTCGTASIPYVGTDTHPPTHIHNIMHKRMHTHTHTYILQNVLN